MLPSVKLKVRKFIVIETILSRPTDDQLGRQPCCQHCSFDEDVEHLWAVGWSEKQNFYNLGLPELLIVANGAQNNFLKILSQNSNVLMLHILFKVSTILCTVGWIEKSRF